MSVEAPGTNLVPPEDPLVRSGVMRPETWTPHAPVGTGGHPHAEGFGPEPGTFEQALPTQVTSEPGSFSRRTESVTEVPATPSEPVEQVLSDTVKQNYYNLARSGKGEDAQRFGALTAELTPGERADYEAFRHAKDAEMIAAKTAEVEARQAEAAARPVQPVMPEVQPGADSEAPMLLLHSLKLRDPNAFKQAFATLSGAEKGRFDAFEAREDARIKANVPAAAPMIPKLSADGERFVTPPAPQATPQNTEAAAQRYGAAEDFHPVAPRAPGEARDIFDAARRPTPHPKTGAAKVLQTIKGLPRRLARRSLIHRSR